MFHITAVVYAVVFAASQVFADETEDAIKSCVELLNPTYMENECCPSIENFFKDTDESCLPEKGKEWKCENSKCLLAKHGFIDGDKILEDKVREGMTLIDQMYPDMKEMTKLVRAECLDGQYEQVPTGDDCAAMKLETCVFAMAMINCPKWKNNDVCKPAMKHAEKCHSIKIAK